MTQAAGRLIKKRRYDTASVNYKTRHAVAAFGNPGQPML